ncbi:NAD(P)H oxidoreductase [Kluyvera cryocrescens]|uniref:NAD(P)H oxidoreductase n=1 Tax=Kluyvera cryocrescens TaxID=580 RepID=UPI0028BEC9C4|nr:NAD(P)H oxidoreductase [Kluyvera cryocrescens]WNN73833.1 NAD(P)H oxidoreductase [Kluyvera cryocrescens]
MKTEKLYIIWAHPRTTSLTARVVEEIQGQAAEHGIEVTSLDLYRSHFDPVLAEADEPDWNNAAKQYSADIHRLYAEVEANDTVVMVFPVWWFSFPAIMKGYIDRVWNNGLAYGDGSTLKGKKFRFIALVGATQATHEKYGWEKNMTDYVIGMMKYLEVDDTKIDYLYNTLGLEEQVRADHLQQLFAQTRGIINDLVK